MQRLTTLALALTLTLLVGTSAAAPAADTHARRVPKRSMDTFVAQAAQRSLADIELSDLALQRSESAAVRRLARRAHDEDAHTFETLLGVATGAGITAAPPETLDLEQRGIKSKLAALHGAAFDHAYIEALRTNDDRNIALYRGYGATTKDDALKPWIAEQLGTIRKRRQLIESTALELR